MIAQITKLQQESLKPQAQEAPAWLCRRRLEQAPHSAEKCRWEPKIHFSQGLTHVRPALIQVQINYSQALLCPYNVNTARYH